MIIRVLKLMDLFSNENQNIEEDEKNTFCEYSM